MALKEYKPEKLLYTMGEVTEMFDVKPSLIRFWERRFDILQPKKNKKGNRLFTPADVENLELIYHLVKERGMTLSGVEKYLKTNKEEALCEAEVVRRLQTVRALLVEIREELKEEGEGEVRVFTADVTEAETAPETVSPTVFAPAPEPPSDVPNPDEFTEEVLPGEIVDPEPEADDFWSDEQSVDEEPEVEETPEPEATAFENGADEEEEDREGDWQDEAEIPDEEVSVPFTAQPLFDLEETAETAPEEETGQPEPEAEKPSAFDTQQSLF